MVPTPYSRVEVAPSSTRQTTIPFSHHRKQAPQRIAFIALVSIFSLSALKAGKITLTVPTNIVAPSIQVGPNPIALSSGDQTMEIHYTGKLGWQLTGEITQNMVEGWESGIQIPASFIFKSITHISGSGNNGTAGITISPDQSMISADPNFGKGRFSIVFETIYNVPALPYADTYHGLLNFTAQE